MSNKVTHRDYPVTPAQAFALVCQLSAPQRPDYRDVLPEYKGPSDREDKRSASKLAAEQLTAMGVNRGMAGDALSYLLASRPTTPEGVKAKKARGLAILFGRGGVEATLPGAKTHTPIPDKAPSIQLSPEELGALIQQAVTAAVEQAVGPLQAQLEQMKQVPPVSKAPKASKASKVPKMGQETAPPVPTEVLLHTEAAEATEATEADEAAKAAAS